MAVVIETTAGDFTVDLYIEERPQACKNFLKLCKIKYYNFCLFHSIQHNFIAQTGDPTGSGKNGESVYGKIFGEERKFFEAELVPKMKHSKAGLLSMVNCGDNMLGSQFFLTLSSELQSLDGEHCVFGEVAEGSEILLKLNEVICDNDHRPYQDIRITHTVILEDPFDDPSGLVVPDGSPEPSKETLLNGRIAADEDLDESKGLTPQELEEMVRQREAQAQATILEIVGDLPDADMAPPENVLFVCKLNPVTSDDDLEIIFSRFGKVKSCEVIRDKNTGDSLQYAFVEFEEQKSCEDAFFKMDNVLIDDRRIHVDFSQSVSKMKWKGKGRGVEHFNEDKSSNHHKNTPRNTERMPPPKERKNKMDDRDRANGRHDNSSKNRHHPRDQQSRQDPDRNKYNSNVNSSRRENHDDRQNLKDGSRGHHRDNHVERERVDKEEGKRGGRDERNQKREKPHGWDGNGRRERGNTRDRHHSDKVRDDRNETREGSRHDERNREERKERTHREDRTRDESYKMDRHHQDNRGREERRDRAYRDERLGRPKHSREEGREESKYSDGYNNKGRERDISQNDKKLSRERNEVSHLKKEVAASKVCDSKKRPIEETGKNRINIKTKETPEKTKKGSKQKSSRKKRRSVSSSSSSSSSSDSSSSSSSGSDSDSSDTSIEKPKKKSKESPRKKAKMVKKSKIKSKLSSTKVK